MDFNSIIKALTDYSSDELGGYEDHVKAYPQFRKEQYGNKRPTETSKISAVLVLFYPFNGRSYFTLIKRPTYNGYHSGQVAFPGGKKEPTDNSLKDTALREAFEEIGVHQSSVKVVNRLSDLYIPISDFLVSPFIGICSETPSFSHNKREVEYVIPVLTDSFISSAICDTEIEVNGKVMNVPAYILNEEKVWGATAMILSELQAILLKKLVHC